MFIVTIVLSFLAGFVVRCDDNNYYIVEVSKETDRIRRPFYIYWNVPTMQCKSKGIPFAGLYEKFGIIQNENDHFLGEKMVILYDPGLFPALFKNESNGKLRFRNGGVPQEGNLTEHMKAFEKSVLHSIPDENFDGVAVIDFESWRPIFKQNYGVLTPYKDISYDIERKRHPWWLDQWVKHEAERRFEEAGRNFMEMTLAKAKQLRNKARWGYYGFPYCFNSDHRDHCSRDTMRENDRCHWLWSKSDALFPSVYSSKSVNTDMLKAMIRGRVKEAARVVGKSAGILPYVWFRQRDGDYFDEKDLKTIFNTIYNTEGSSGVVIWGSSNDVNTKNKCEKLYNYIYNKFGPLVSKYAKYNNKVDENKVTDNDVQVTDTNTADTNIVIEKTTTEKNELEFVFDLQEGPEGTIHVVQPIEAVQNNGIDNPIQIDGSNLTSGQIVISNPNTPESNAVVLFQQFNGLTIIDLLNKMFGKNVNFANGNYSIGNGVKTDDENFYEQDNNKIGSKNGITNDEIDINDIFDMNSDENHQITTEQNFDNDLITKKEEIEATTRFFTNYVNVNEKGIHFIDNVDDVFQNIHKKILKPAANSVIETTTDNKIIETQLQESIQALKQVFSELRQKKLTSETGNFLNFLEMNDDIKHETTSTTEVPDTFDVLEVITEADDKLINEINNEMNIQTPMTLAPVGKDQETTTEYNDDFAHMFIPLKDTSDIKTDDNAFFRQNVTSTANSESTENSYTVSYETTEPIPIKARDSNEDRNIDSLLVTTTEDNIKSTTSQYLVDNLDSLGLDNYKQYDTTEKNKNEILGVSLDSTTTVQGHEMTTDIDIADYISMFIPIKNTSDIAFHDLSTTDINNTNTEVSTFANYNSYKATKNYTTESYETTEPIDFKYSARNKLKYSDNLFYETDNYKTTTDNFITESSDTTEHNYFKPTVKDRHQIFDVIFRTTDNYGAIKQNRFHHNGRLMKKVSYLLLRPKMDNFASTTSRFEHNNQHKTMSSKSKVPSETAKRKNYIFSDLILNNNENLNWLSNMAEGFDNRATTATTPSKNISTSEEDDALIKNFLHEYENTAGSPLADIVSDKTIKLDETLVNDPEFREVLSKEVEKLTQQQNNKDSDTKFDAKQLFLYADAKRDLAKELNKSYHFFYNIPKETTSNNAIHANKKAYIHFTNNKTPTKILNVRMDHNLASTKINNLYSEVFKRNIKTNNTRKSRTLKDLMLLHNASYPHSFQDQKADKSIEYILNNELDISLEEEKDVKRDVVYDKSESLRNINDNLTSALDSEKTNHSYATNSCNGNNHVLLFTLVFSFSIAKCL